MVIWLKLLLNKQITIAQRNIIVYSLIPVIVGHVRLGATRYLAVVIVTVRIRGCR